MARLRRAAGASGLWAALLLFGLMLLPGAALAHATERMLIQTLPTLPFILGCGLAVLITSLAGARASTSRSVRRNPAADVSGRKTPQANERSTSLSPLPQARSAPPDRENAAPRAGPGTATRARQDPAPEPVRMRELARWAGGGSGASWAGFMLTAALIGAGLLGSRDPLGNPLPLVVWVLIWAGLVAASVLVGDLWHPVSPWRGPARLVRRLIGRKRRAGLARLGAWPAVAGLLGLAWLEIVSLAPADPAGLAQVAGIYWLAIFLCAVLEGEDWPDRGEGLSLCFALLGQIAPLRIARPGGSADPGGRGGADPAAGPANRRERHGMAGLGQAATGDAPQACQRTEPCACAGLAAGAAPALPASSGAGDPHLSDPAAAGPAPGAAGNALPEAYGAPGAAALPGGRGGGRRARRALPDHAPDRAGARPVHRLMLGLPGAAITGMPAPGGGTFAFITLLIAAVTFDGLSESFRWMAFLGINPLEFPGRSAVVWQNSAGLVLVWGLVSLAILAAFYAGRLPLRAILAFLPVAAGYHSAHYLTQLLTGGQYLLAALNDPLHRGSALLGLPEHWVSFGFLADLGVVRIIWAIQVALILGGHLLAVRLTLRLAPGSARAHVPLAGLMTGFTSLGLWLLSTPAVG